MVYFWWLKSLWIFLLILPDIRSNSINTKTCLVTEIYSGESKPCQGVFIFEGESYYGCTNVKSENEKSWCSTKVDPLTYEHVKNGDFFGYCPSNCMTSEEGKIHHDELMMLQRSIYI